MPPVSPQFENAGRGKQTHYESEGDEPNLLQCGRERLPSRGMSLSASYDNGYYFHRAVSDGKCDDDATEPAVHQIECIVRYIKQANEEVVPASHKNQWDHVDERKRTGSISEMLQLRDQRPAPFDAVSAEDDVHGDDADE